MSDRALPFQPFMQYTDNSGTILNGGKLYFYEAGTSTPKTTWTDSAMATANDNPVTLDSYGRATIFVRGLYKVILKDSAGVTISTWDYLYYPNISTVGATLIDDTSVANMRNTLGLGTAAVLDVGTSGNNVVQLTSASKLPAVDGSLLTNIATGAASIPYGYKNGLGLSRSANTTLGISAGAAKDASNAYGMVLSSAWTKTFSNWAAATGSGGLDALSIASSTWYFPHLIYNSTTGSTDVLISTSPTSPTMPSGYVYHRRIGAIKTDTNPYIVNFSQYGNLSLWKDPVASWTAASNGNIGTSQQLVTLDVPIGIQVEALITATAGNNSAATNVYFSSPDATDEAPASYTTPPFGQLNVATTTLRYSSGQIKIRTNSSGQIRVRCDQASTAVDICVLGWYDLFENG